MTTIVQALNFVFQAVLNDLVGKAAVPELVADLGADQPRTIGQVVQQITSEQKAKVEAMTVSDFAALVIQIDGAQNKPAGRKPTA